MIKLTDILREIESEEKFKKMAYSWQAPSGKFISVKSSHAQDAWEWGGRQPNTDYMVIFWKRGWNRIHADQHTLFSHNEFQPPNNKQKSALIELAMELGLQEVKYDAGEDYKILWSAHDVLEEFC